MCVDDLRMSFKDPKSIIDVLTNKNYFKIKETLPISYHLGCNFSRDDDDTLYLHLKVH